MVVAALVAAFAGGIVTMRIVSQSDTVQEGSASVETTKGVRTEKKLRTFTYPDLHVSFNYFEPLQQTALNNDDTSDNFIGRLTSDDPPMIVSIRTETGIRLPASLSRTDAKSLLMGNMDKALPQRFPDYDESSNTSYELFGKTVIDRVFTYTGPSGTRAKQRLLALITDENTAVYISMQCEEVRFDEVNSEFFTPIQESIRFE